MIFVKEKWTPPKNINVNQNFDHFFTFSNQRCQEKRWKLAKDEGLAFKCGLLCIFFFVLFPASSLEKVLEAITTATERKGVARFSPIVQGLSDRSVQLQVSVHRSLSLPCSPVFCGYIAAHALVSSHSKIHSQPHTVVCKHRLRVSYVNTIKAQILEEKLHS